MTTLAKALLAASRHWEGRPGGPIMVTMAGRCATLLGSSSDVGKLGVKDGVTLLGKLRGASLSPKTVASYYGAFRRMLALNGVPTVDWPKAPTPPRRTRDPLTGESLEGIRGWLTSRGWPETADLACLLEGTGLRINIEALNTKALTLTPGDEYDVLHIKGKGGHERLIPVVHKGAREVLASEARMKVIRSVTYDCHVRRWRQAVRALGITSRLATPHAARHFYATDALAKSGGNLAMVQDLLGHSDPATTARYLAVDLDSKAKALSRL